MLHHYRKCFSQLACHLVWSWRVSRVTSLCPSRLHVFYGGRNTSGLDYTTDAAWDCLDSVCTGISSNARSDWLRVGPCWLVHLTAFVMQVISLQCSHICRFSSKLAVDRDSSVGIATRYRLDGPGIESRWEGAWFGAPFQAGPGTHPASYTKCTRALPGVKRSERGVDHPPSSSA